MSFKLKDKFYRVLCWIFDKPSVSCYWNIRYMLSSGSGYISANDYKYRDYIWSIIENNIGKLNDVIDVGCGDLIFWEYRDCNKYIGIDISPIIIKRNIKTRPEWSFISSSSSADLQLKSDVVICLNTLYHIMNDVDYNKTIDNLISWSKKWIIITTWHKRPNIDENDLYRKYRDFSVSEKKIIDSGFDLIVNQSVSHDEYGHIWIFRRYVEE